MQDLTINELIKPDDATLHFTPYGLSTNGVMKPEASLKYLQGMITRSDLNKNVPESTKSLFDRLRTLYLYGLFEYGCFTLVHNLMFTILENALSEKFLEWSNLCIELEKAGSYCKYPINNYFDVYDKMRFSKRKNEWKLRDHPEFDGSFKSLIDWARKKGFLKGQRNRIVEDVIIKIRNNSSHPYECTVVSPVDAARAINDIAEIINHLWGVETPGGRLYPSPLKRIVQVISEGTAGSSIGGIEDIDELNEEYASRCLIIKAVENVRFWSFWNLSEIHDLFQGNYEITDFPCMLIWGPGNLEETKKVLIENGYHWCEDQVDYIDRIFLIRTYNNNIDFPIDHKNSMTIGEDKRDGEWYMIKADYPSDAMIHVSLSFQNKDHSDIGRCKICGVETLGFNMSWEEAQKKITMRNP